MNLWMWRPYILSSFVASDKWWWQVAQQLCKQSSKLLTKGVYIFLDYEIQQRAIVWVQHKGVEPLFMLNGLL